MTQPAPESGTEGEEEHGCPICMVQFKPDDICSTDIELGAAQAHGVPVHAVGIEEFTVSKYRGITHHRTMKEAVTAALAEPARIRSSLSLEEGEKP